MFKKKEDKTDTMSVSEPAQKDLPPEDVQNLLKQCFIEGTLNINDSTIRGVDGDEILARRVHLSFDSRGEYWILCPECLRLYLKAKTRRQRKGLQLNFIKLLPGSMIFWKKGHVFLAESPGTKTQCSYCASREARKQKEIEDQAKAQADSVMRNAENLQHAIDERDGNIPITEAK